MRAPARYRVVTIYGSDGLEAAAHHFAPFLGRLEQALDAVGALLFEKAHGEAEVEQAHHFAGHPPDEQDAVRLLVREAARPMAWTR